NQGAGRRVTAARELDPDIRELDRVTIRFAGDSGDGMQLTGTQFTRTAAVFGNDISTLPDFPAEIRAPAGSLPGVSGFQISFSSSEIHTPGDQPDVLVAMNPAHLEPGVYRNITGNEATALGFLAASRLAHRPLFYGSYPITPASDILHQLSTYKSFGVKTFQAEDEIAAIGAAIGASYGGALG